MASGDTQLYIWVKIDDDQERNAIEIETTSTTSVSRLVQTVLVIERVEWAPDRVRAQSSDGTNIEVDMTVKNLIQSDCGTTRKSPLLLTLPEGPPIKKWSRRRFVETFPSPSDVGKSGSSQLQKVDEHRAGGDGLHVSLQVNTFGKFMDIVEGEEEIESLCYEVAGRVLQKMSVYYRFEFERKDAFLVEMEKIFPRTVRIIPVEEGKAKSECTILVNNFRVGNYEFKNEFAGITSDPNNQNIGYFVHLQAPCEDERAPMLLVSLIGCHYFQVFGAVWNGDKVCIDPLCSPASLLLVPRDPLHGIAKFARIISALKRTVLELGRYYENALVSERRINSEGPYFRNCTASTLEYRKKMGAAAWLYEAKLHGDVEVEVVVKFVRFQYGRDPHECLAGKQLAPKLYSCDTLDGGWYAIVMEKVVGRMIKAPVNQEVKSRLMEAMEALHSNRFVHGDLRPQNVLVVGDSVRIVDFDWAGLEGTARYPKELNMENKWHDQVECGGLIAKEHDRYQIEEIIN